MDAAAHRVQFSDVNTLGYDALVIATGARHSYFGRDEWAAHALELKTIDEATRIRRRILLAMEHAEAIRQESKPDRKPKAMTVRCSASSSAICRVLHGRYRLMRFWTGGRWRQALV